MILTILADQYKLRYVMFIRFRQPVRVNSSKTISEMESLLVIPGADYEASSIRS